MAIFLTQITLKGGAIAQSRIFFEEKDETFFHKQNSKKLKILSRIRQFICREAIQLEAKFALANLMRSKSQSRIFFEEKDETYLNLRSKFK